MTSEGLSEHSTSDGRGAGGAYILTVKNLMPETGLCVQLPQSMNVAGQFYPSAGFAWRGPSALVSVLH